MRSRTKRNAPTLRERVEWITRTVNRLSETVAKLAHFQSADTAMYTAHDERIRTLEERVRNLTDYINRNRV